ncbi:MAG: restriction endonuclease subunit S, partial [Candidatus Subteraquimicrobiales bacterium]|nr:restriction endonuclease subunit S [Candidatus Subteraquimicrobiales bacterium]
DFSIFVSLALLKFPKQFLSPYYLELVLNSPFVKAQSKKNTMGVGNKNLVLKYIENLILPLPPLDEQCRIVARVDQLMSLCDKLEAGLMHSQVDSEKLMEVVVGSILAGRDSDGEHGAE